MKQYLSNYIKNGTVFILVIEILMLIMAGAVWVYFWPVDYYTDIPLFFIPLLLVSFIIKSLIGYEAVFMDRVWIQEDCIVSEATLRFKKDFLPYLIVILSLIVVGTAVFEVLVRFCHFELGSIWLGYYLLIAFLMICSSVRILCKLLLKKNTVIPDQLDHQKYKTVRIDMPVYYEELTYKKGMNLHWAYSNGHYVVSNEQFQPYADREYIRVPIIQRFVAKTDSQIMVPNEKEFVRAIVKANRFDEALSPVFP